MSSNWIYKGKVILDEDIPDWAIGFIYIIENKKAVDEETGRYFTKPYIGKKILQSTKRSKIGVREKAATKTRKTYKVTKKDSGWKDYWGSSEELAKDLQELGEEAFERTIIEWCHSKKYMTYAEVRHQILNSALEDTTYNKNILSRFFRKDLIKPEK